MHPLIQLKKATSVFLIVLLLACFALPQRARAVSPAPDGGYAGGNTAEGASALFSLTTGGFNAAVGWFSLYNNTTGSNNTAIGAGTLFANTGEQNTGTGAAALFHNTGNFNTANGAFALVNNTTGGGNTANGASALFSNTVGQSNTANGGSALRSNTTGTSNTANGATALLSNTTGNENTANGAFALVDNTTGSGNTALGDAAGINHVTGDNNLYIGNEGVDGEGNTIRIGSGGLHTKTFIAAIRGVTTGVNDAIPVLIDSAGQLGTTSSSRRFKTDIKPMDKASKSILALKPVSFRYKVHKDTTPQFGLIAEEVAEVNPDLVIYDADGKPYTVRYEAVNAMLLNEFLKEHRAVQEQGAIIARQQKQIEALTEGLQKVSAQLELSKPAAQTVLNNQ
jgi:hypothetical protein